MSSISDDFDLISQMVNETFSGLDEDSSIFDNDEFQESFIASRVTSNTQIKFEKEPIQLEFHFDYFLGAYDGDRGCYVFQVHDEIIECPENWGPFKFSSFKSGEIEDLFKLQKHEDIDFFFEIIEAVVGKSFKSLSCVNCGTHLILSYEEDDDQKLAEVISIDFSRQQLKAA